MLYRDCGTNIRGKGANNLVFSSSGPWLGVGEGGDGRGKMWASSLSELGFETWQPWL